jgi:hypothetical protein
LILINREKPKNPIEAPRNLSNHSLPNPDASAVMMPSSTDNVGKKTLLVKKNQLTLTKFIDDNEKLINVLVSCQN